MPICKARFQMLIFAAVGLSTLASGSLPAAPASTIHHLYINGTEDSHTFVGKIDHLEFTALNALEDHLASLPAEDRVDCRLPNSIGGNPDMKQLKQCFAALKAFCQAHHLKFSGSDFFL